MICPLETNIDFLNKEEILSPIYKEELILYLLPRNCLKVMKKLFKLKLSVNITTFKIDGSITNVYNIYNYFYLHKAKRFTLLYSASQRTMNSNPLPSSF